MPSFTIEAVESILSMILVAVPAFKRVEPESTSLPVGASIAMSAWLDVFAPVLQLIATASAPISRA